MKAVLKGALLFALSLSSAGAMAQGWFAGGAVGVATQQDYENGTPLVTTDDSDDSYRVFGGYQISPMQAVVASYLSLGTAYYDGPGFGGFTDKMSAEGYDISYVAGWAPGQQQRFSLFGSVGVFAFTQNVRYTDSTGFFKYKDSGTTFSLGIGSEINLSASGTNAWGLHVEYQLFKDVGSRANSGHEHDRDVLSVGITYRFFGRD